MSKMIQVRNVPDRVHATLRARAMGAGLSLSDFLLQELREIAERPTLKEVFDRVSYRGSVTVTERPADALRAEREHR